MCTVTFVPGRDGYRLAMNRDEKLSRPAGLPPSVREVAGRLVVSPSEPGGGTWIALDDSGVCLALINWHAIQARVAKAAISRGEVVQAAGGGGDAASLNAILERLPLDRLNPFRLIGVFLASETVREWRWDLDSLEAHPHPWTPQQWISSGFDEPRAQRIRGETFAWARAQATFGDPEWLRALHRSHEPELGPFSTCMHRADAMTVSFTEIAVEPGIAVLRHQGGPPCRCEETVEVRLAVGGR